MSTISVSLWIILLCNLTFHIHVYLAILYLVDIELRSAVYVLHELPVVNVVDPDDFTQLDPDPKSAKYTQSMKKFSLIFKEIAKLQYFVLLKSLSSGNLQ